jgi:hypothetical protein
MFEPRVKIVDKVKWNREGIVEFKFKGGCEWQGAKRKDFWCPDDNWENIIKSGSQIRTWTVQFSRVIGFEVWIEDRNKWHKNQKDNWCSVWCVGNDFDKKDIREKRENDYNHFVEKEGSKIAKLIDKGKTLKQIDKLISQDHSGNTYGWALQIGIEEAKNKVNADKIRKEHNTIFGCKGSTGVVNPATLTINFKEKK